MPQLNIVNFPFEASVILIALLFVHVFVISVVCRIILLYRAVLTFDPFSQIRHPKLQSLKFETVLLRLVLMCFTLSFATEMILRIGVPAFSEMCELFVPWSYFVRFIVHSFIFWNQIMLVVAGCLNRVISVMSFSRIRWILGALLLLMNIFIVVTMWVSKLGQEFSGEVQLFLSFSFWFCTGVLSAMRLVPLIFFLFVVLSLFSRTNVIVSSFAHVYFCCFWQEFVLWEAPHCIFSVFRSLHGPCSLNPWKSCF